MVLLLALRKGNSFYTPECFIDLPMDLAVKHTADISTEIMKYDEDVSDVIVYTKRSFERDVIPASLSHLHFMFHTFDFSLKK